MTSSDSPSSLPPIAPLSEHKENALPINSKIAELTESRTELFSKIQGLKQDLQNWRSKMDTQVKVYQSELSELKKSLNVEVDQLRSEFQELRTTLKQQQEDVTASLKSLDLQDVRAEAKEADVPGEAKETEVLKVESNDEKKQDLHTETADTETEK